MPRDGLFATLLKLERRRQRVLLRTRAPKRKCACATRVVDSAFDGAADTGAFTFVEPTRESWRPR